MLGVRYEKQRHRVCYDRVCYAKQRHCVCYEKHRPRAPMTTTGQSRQSVGYCRTTCRPARVQERRDKPD